MLESQGIFNLAARSQANESLARNSSLLHAQAASSADPAGAGASGSGGLLTNTQISPAARLKAYLKEVLDKTDDNLISDDMLKRLDKASKSDNKEISAEKLRQAKAKLQSLRMQAQIAAASGDPKALRRIAQEAAQAAREVANAVRGLADGIAATALTADGSASGSVNANAGGTAAPAEGENAQAASAAPSDAQVGEVQAGSAQAGEAQQAGSAQAGATTEPEAAGQPSADAAKDAAGQPTGQSKDPEAAYTQPVPAGEDPKSWGREALRKLSDEAHVAIAQARGLIAFCAQAARAARKHRPDPDEDKAYRDLQSEVSDADKDVDAAITAAGKEIAEGTDASGDAGSAFAGGTDSGFGLVIDSATVVVQTTTVVAVGTDVTV
ncbi:MAG TPA: hypothetical protein VHA35_24035 [Dongiaceae bacterium]|nr:hypothetical protein [Dongiaceae bacterium]